MTAAINRTRLMASTIIAGALLIGVPAFAQTTQPAEAAPEAESANADIVVTGTRISRPDLEVASPVNVVGQAEIQLRQVNTAEELLRDLPSVRPNLGSAVNNGGTGASYIDLRGLGENRTLVLLDGRRIVPFDLNGVVDTDVIPTSVVERVDLVTGGASSTYGADAVAGAVNFITKRNFSGVIASGNYRISQRGDARDWRANVTVGANLDDNRGNVMLDVGYAKRSPLEVTNRAIGRTPVNSANGGFNGSQATLPVLFTSPTTTALGLGAGNGLGAVLDPATGTLRAAVQNDLLNTNNGTYFQTPSQRWSAFAAARYEVTDGIEVYTTGMFQRKETKLQLASSATFNNPYKLPLSNAYLPVGVRNQLCNAIAFTAAQCALAAAATSPTSPGYREVDVTSQRRFLEYGPRGQSYAINMFQVQAGVRGQIIDGLRYDLSGQFGETRQSQTRENWGSYSRVQQALRSSRNAAGTPVCTDTTNGCVPINLFGPLGSITPDQLTFIDLDALVNRVVRQEVVTGAVNGDLFTSPFATSAIAFSIGGEYRKISARAQPDASTQIQSEVLGTGARTPPDFGVYNVKEVFGEIIAPLVSDVPFIHSLTAEAGVRYSDYSTTGTSTTWKAGGSYEPIDGFKFRGMYQVAVRSPNINELFQSSVTGLSSLTQDPCQAALPNANAGLRALCIATGAPAAAIGSIPSPSSNQINATTSGNRNLDVERANTYTLGAVVTPSFLPRFSATIDYYNITVKDAITQPASADILNGCYSAALNPTFANNAFCQLIGRNPLNGSLNGAGETPGVILSYSNLGKIETAGVDVSVSYRFDFADFGIERDIGALAWSFTGTYLDYYRFQANPNAINRDCTSRYSSTGCTNPRPQFKYLNRWTYSKGPFDLSLLWTHIGSVGLEPFTPAAQRPALNVPQAGGPDPSTILAPFRRIKAYNYFDLSLKTAIGDNVEMVFTIDNMFDKKAPLVGSGVGGTAFNNGNTFPTIYDVIGRSFTVGGRLKF